MLSWLVHGAKDLVHPSHMSFDSPFLVAKLIALWTTQVPLISATPLFAAEKPSRTPCRQGTSDVFSSLILMNHRSCGFSTKGCITWFQTSPANDIGYQPLGPGVGINITIGPGLLISNSIEYVFPFRTRIWGVSYSWNGIYSVYSWTKYGESIV